MRSGNIHAERRSQEPGGDRRQRDETRSGAGSELRFSWTRCSGHGGMSAPPPFSVFSLLAFFFVCFH